MTAFITFFMDLNAKLPFDGETGFFVVPLHRVFSYYFTRVMMHNYLVDKDKYPNRDSKEIF